MFENKSIKITFNQSNTYFFEGRIDESFPLELAVKMNQPLLHLSLEKISYINSSGVLQLIKFLQSLEKSQHVYFEDVSAIVVSQMSLVRGILSPRFQLKSFFVPYLDKETDEQVTLKLTIEDVAGKRLPLKRHPERGTMLEPDVNPERFLNFMNF